MLWLYEIRFVIYIYICAYIYRPDYICIINIIKNTFDYVTYMHTLTSSECDRMCLNRAEPSTWHRRSSPETGWFLSRKVTHIIETEITEITGITCPSHVTDMSLIFTDHLRPTYHRSIACLWRRNPPVWCGSRWLRSYGASYTGPQGQQNRQGPGCLLDQSVRVARVQSLENGSIMNWKLKPATKRESDLHGWEYRP